MFKIPRRFRGIKRFEQVLSVLNKYGLGHHIEKAGLKNKSLTFRVKHRAFKIKPVDLRLMLEELGGGFLKLGEMLSLRQDIIPLEYCDELSKLKDEAEPFDYEELEHIIRFEIKKPLHRIFKSFEKKPLASSIVWQIHLAKLRNKEKVVVKVMRPGIKASLQTDLEIIDYLLSILKHRMNHKIPEVSKALNDFKQWLDEELDFTKEAHIIKQFNKNFKNQKGCILPEVYEELTTSKVITTSFIEGVELRRVLARPERYEQLDKKRIVNLLAQSVLKQIFIKGLFIANLSPKSILLSELTKSKEKGKGKGNNSLNSVGFVVSRTVGRLASEQRDKLGLLLISMIELDAERTAYWLLSLDSEQGNDKNIDEEELQRAIRNVLKEYCKTPIKELDLIGMFFKTSSIANDFGIKLPLDVVLAGRTLKSLQEICSSLDKEFSLAEEAVVFVNKSMRLEKGKTSIASLFRRLVLKNRALSDTKLIKSEETILEGSDLNEFSEVVDKADLTFDTINSEIQKLNRAVKSESLRIILGVIIVALLIGASLTYNLGFGLAEIFTISAFLLLVYLLALIIRDLTKKKM